MKWSFLLFSSFLCLQAIAQYPATGNKARLGWQTTGDGLVYRGAIGDTTTLDPSGINNAWMLLDTANGNLYAYRAKAWRLVSGGGGSVSDTLTGEVKGPLDSTYIDTVANIIFTTATDTTVGVGELEYNDTQGSLIQGLKGGNVTNVIGQQIHQRVTNATGGTLTKGTAVFLHGSQGNRITVRKALATVDSTSANTFGIVAESIANNQSGYVITEGLITNMNTNALTEGAAVYLSPTVAGELTTTKPQAPQHTVYIGVCVKQNAGSGELFVKIRNGQELDELHDVLITSPASNASLYYNAAQGVWRDTGAAVLVADTTVMLSPYLKKQDTLSLSNRINTKLNISDTSVFARDFQISGTANYLAKFTGSNAVGNSVIQDNGTNVGISATPSSFKLDINGSTHTTGDFYADRAARSASAGFVSAQTNNRWLAGMISNSGNWHVYDLLRSTSVMTLDSATGNVGIGTTTPRTPLDIRFSGSYPNYYTDTIARVEFNETGAGCCMDITGMYVKANGGGGQSNVGIIGEGGGVSYDKSIGIKGIAKHNDTQGPGIAYGVIGEVSASKLGSSGAIGTTIAGYFKNTAKVDGTHYGVLVETDSSGDYGVYQTGFGANYFKGNVGIATSSPSRPLHVNANSSMIIPSGATGTRPASGANGDIRYSTTFNNIEFYDLSRGLWERPLVGTVATNKVAFASGDTLTSNTNFHWDNSNTRLGIGIASPTTTIHVVGRATVDLGGANLFINAGNNNVTGVNNIGLGTNSLTSVTTGGQNIAIGGEVLKTTTIGNSNFAIGTSSLRDNISGSNNVSFGTNAMLENKTGSGNLAIGTDAMRKNDADNNIGIGFGALSQNISGTSNTALGYASLLNVNTSGNTAIGSEVLKSVTTSKQNTAIGSSALFSLTTGDNNVSIGRLSGITLTSGGNNVLIGETAAYFAGSGFGSPTTSINNSIIIGQDSRPSTASGNTNEVVIGTSAIGNGSNTTTIGNSSTTKTFFQYGETYIGTATDNGAYNLQVAGGSYLSGEIKYVNRPAAAAVTNVGVDANGVLREATSSQRFKDNITPYQKGLSDAMRLQAKTYTYKGDTTLQAGFIAEDVHEAGLTEYVNYDKEGKPYSLQYGNMVTLLLNAMKEQQAQIEALKKEIEALKNK